MPMPGSRPPPRLQLHLLGDMQVTLDGAPLAGKLYGKVLALLAYLAVEASRNHTREQLADLLWPAMTAEAARTNLRQAVYYLRRALSAGTDDTPGFLIANRDTINFSPNSPCWLDIQEFTAPLPDCLVCATDQARSPCAGCIDIMERRASLYRDEFLTGLILEEAPEFDEWRDGKRESLHREMLALLERLRQHQRQRAPRRALVHAQRYTDLAPWDEEGHRQLMQLLAESGQRGAALTQYETCRALLSRELGVEPGASTQALAERIRNDAPDTTPAGRIHSASTPAVSANSERRQATVLCCSFALSGNEDSEEIMERLRWPHQRCTELAHSHGGHIVQAHGGIILAYFGFPSAFEDAAQHAVHAALAIMDELSPQTALRIGVHTGIIITDSGSALPDTAGIASTIAQRLCDKAAANEVVISDATRSLVQGYFQLQALHQQTSGEASQRQSAYKVIRRTRAKTRLDAASRLSALVGRQAELALLHALWNEAIEDGGRLLLVRGDAGLGKSRLIRTLRDTLAETACTIRELHCFPEYSQTPLYPVIALLGSLSGFTPDDPSAIRLHKLSAHLARHHPALHDEAMALLAPLLSKNPEDTSPSPWQQQKQRILSILLELVDSAATRQPLLILMEDLHWMDPSSLELLERFARIRTKKPVLMLLTARNGFQPPWIGAEASLELPPLSDADIAQLIAGVDSSLPAETIRRITARADGVPLFAEEMALLAAEPSAVDKIPATLHFLLLARLDLLKEARHIAQLAATVGREFDRELLERIAEVDSHSLDEAMNGLLDAHLITASPASATDFRFRHGLIQEAAYHSQTRSDRQAAHRRIAEALTTHFPRRATRQPERIAHHFTQAGAAAEAIPWWLAAGRRALRTFAYPEAVNHLRSGLALIRQRPPDDERGALELDFLLPLGQALLALRGYGSAEAAAVYDRAFELCRDLAPDLRRFEVLWGLWMVSSSRQNSSFSTSTRLAQELLHNARKSKDGELLAYAHSANANVSLWRGEIGSACRYAEIVIASSPKTKRLDRLGGHDPRVSSLGHLSWARFYQGQHRKALAASRRSIEVAQQLSDPDSTCFALVYAGELRRFMHDAPGTIRYAQEALALANQYQLALWQGGSAMQLGWARAFAGDAAGIEQITASAAAMTEVMPGVLVSFLHALAEAHGFLEQREAQLDAVEKALRAAASTDEHFHKAELYRIKGESLARLDRPGEALEAFHEAKRIAHEQGAQAIALRASTAMDLALP